MQWTVGGCCMIAASLPLQSPAAVSFIPELVTNYRYLHADNTLEAWPRESEFNGAT